MFKYKNHHYLLLQNSVLNTSEICSIVDGKLQIVSVADQGFPQDGGYQPFRGVPTYDFAIFPKLHEIERIWTREGHPKFYFVDPPLCLLMVVLTIMVASTHQ